MAFMDSYEGNKERTDRWIATYPQGRLETHIIEFNAEKGYVLLHLSFDARNGFSYGWHGKGHKRSYGIGQNSNTGS